MLSCSRVLIVCAAPWILVPALVARAENRSLDGTGNHLSLATRGAALQPMIRFGYGADFLSAEGGMISDNARANARDISNLLLTQSASVPSARNLSDYIWAWGQFLSHDTDLTTTSDGPDINGWAPIAVNDPLDSLGPNPIPFTRANFANVLPVPRGSLSGRTPLNEVTSYIDASQVYGSDLARATALRTDGGLGAKLLTSANNLLPFNTAGLPVENHGPLPDSQMFLAGDIRANENSLLTSLHTVFAREHNRLVDVIADQQPDLSDEDQYQLARKIVGAQMQIITYREFLPALLGNGDSVPRAESYNYGAGQDATITTAFAHAAFRYGHSTVSSQLQLVDDSGTAVGSLAVRNAFYNPTVLSDEPAALELLLKGAAVQVSEEVDLLLVDELRSFLFGPPGAGGLDLAALNIQRGRDVGIPDFRKLAANRGIGIQSFSHITSDPALASALAAVYGDDINNVDAWVGMLAEDHVPGASVGRLLKAEIESQFRRLRDGDRLFYLSQDAGLYSNGILNPEIAAIVDLDHLRLADVILANTSLANLQQNVFFASVAGDYNGDGILNAGDYVVWRNHVGTDFALLNRNPDLSGNIGLEDYNFWAAQFSSAANTGALGSTIPEPAACQLLLGCLAWLLSGMRRRPKVRVTSLPA